MKKVKSIPIFERIIGRGKTKPNTTCRNDYNIDKAGYIRFFTRGAPDFKNQSERKSPVIVKPFVIPEAYDRDVIYRGMDNIRINRYF